MFKFPLQDRIHHSESLGTGCNDHSVMHSLTLYAADHAANDFVVLRSKIRRLPPVHRASLKALLEHLSRIASHADKNKMDAKNLAIVFNPVLFGEDEIPQGDLLNVQPAKVRHSSLRSVCDCLLVQDSVMEDLIENAQILFDERIPPSSPPLPPAPAGEPVPVLTYGSSHTSVTLPQLREAQVADFTPQLPPRPTSSIHPSARSNPPMSPSRISMELCTALTPARPPSPPARPLVQVVPDPTKQLARGKVDTNSTEVTEVALDRSHLLVSPLVESALEQRQQRVAAESVPDTPLTASSQTSSTSSGPF